MRLSPGARAVFLSTALAPATSAICCGEPPLKTPPLFPAWEQNQKEYGFINASGEWAIPPQFEKDSSARAAGYYSTFTNGYAPVKKDGSFGLIDTTGEFVIRPGFKDLGHYSEGRLAAKSAEFYGYVDLDGSWQISPQFTWAFPFSGGLASVVTEAGHYWFIDPEGNPVIKLPESHRPVSDGSGDWIAIRAVNSEAPGVEEFYFINRDGKTLNGRSYTGVTPFQQGLAAVEEAGKWGFINALGMYVIGPDFQGARPFSANGLAAVATRNAREKIVWGFIDKKGRWVLEPIYENALMFTEGVGVVWREGGWRYIDRSGETVFENADRHPLLFDGGLCRVFADTADAKHALTYVDTSGKIIWQQAAVPWVDELKDDRVERRVHACRRIGKLADAAAVAALGKALTDDPSSKVRASAAEALGRIKSEEAIPSLTKALQDKHDTVRSEAASALKEIGDPKVGPDLLETLRRERNSHVRGLLAEALGVVRYRPAMGPILEVLQTDPSEFARGWAAIGLGKMGDKAAVEPLIAALGDSEGDVREKAARSLGQLGDRRATAPLLKLIADPYPHAQRAVIEALGKLKDPRVVDQLTPLLEHEDQWVRLNTIGALGDLKAEPAIPLLIEILSGDDPIATAFAATSLKMITGEEFVSNGQPDAGRWKKWWVQRPKTRK